MRWRGCIKRLNANEGRFCTTIGLPFSSLRGTIIKSNSVSTTNAGNKETWQQKNVKRQHGAQHRAKSAPNSGSRQGLAPCGRFGTAFSREGLGSFHFPPTKTTLWFAIFALAWYNSRINYCVYGKLGNRVEWQQKNENQRNGVLLPAVKRQSSGSRLKVLRIGG